MKKTNLLIISVVSLLALFGVSLSFAANTDRNVYGVYTENYNGAHFSNVSSDIDAIDLDMWGNQSMMSYTASEGVIEGNNYTNLKCEQWDSSKEKYKYGGGGYSSKNSSGYKDMSSYYGGTLKFYARSSSNPNMTKFKVGVKVNNNEVLIPLSNFGFSANGQWQEISIPLTSSTDSNITSSNLTKTQILFMFKHEEANYVLNETIDIDNIRWVKNTTGNFDVTLKNISDNQTATQITWNQDVFRNGWKASKQYLEFDLDQDTSENWHIKIYTDNDGVAGLKASDRISPSLPMCWRIDKEKIPYDYSASGGYKATLSIAQAGEEHNYGLYDSGVSATDPHYYPWFYFVDKEDSGFDSKTDYMTVWSYKGFHAADNGDYWGMSDMNANGKKIAPKLYFGADFSKAIVGSTGSPITYTSNIKVEFVNE